MEGHNIILSNFIVDTGVTGVPLLRSFQQLGNIDDFVHSGSVLVAT